MQVTMTEVNNWLEAETPPWAKTNIGAFQLGLMSAIILCVANGSQRPEELAARIRRAQPKPAEVAEAKA